MATQKQDLRAVFRGRVMRRDGFQCRKCRKPGYDRQAEPVDKTGLEPLDAHHLLGRGVGDEMVGYGVTLCDGCHKATETGDMAWLADLLYWLEYCEAHATDNNTRRVQALARLRARVGWKTGGGTCPEATRLTLPTPSETTRVIRAGG